jgi:hypothetical protein
MRSGSVPPPSPPAMASPGSRRAAREDRHRPQAVEVDERRQKELSRLIERYCLLKARQPAAVEA